MVPGAFDCLRRRGFNIQSAQPDHPNPYSFNFT